MTDTLELSHWINGERTSGDRPAESLNPSDTREVVARTPDGSASDVDDAVAAARSTEAGDDAARREAGREREAARVFDGLRDAA